MCFYAAPSWAWWNDAWQFRKELSVDPAAAGIAADTPIDNVPVLVRLHLGNFGYFGDVDPQAADLRFVAADDSTPLQYEVELFDPLAQIALIWVQVPQLRPGLAFRMYYGNPEVESAHAPAQVYERSYQAVLHFGRRGAVDSTAYANTPVAATATPAGDGIIGSAVRFDGAQLLRFAPSPALRFQPDPGWTVSAWLKLETEQDRAVLAEHGSQAGASVRVVLDRGGTLHLEVLQEARLVDTLPLVGTVPVGRWTHLAWVAGRDTLSVFVDGRLAGSLTTALTPLDAGLTIGALRDGSQALAGVVLDELRLSSTARSREWLALQAAIQGMDSDVVGYGEDAERDGGAEGESHLVTTLRNVDWAGLEGYVIFVCVFMAVFSWYIMITKGISVERTKRANVRFVAAAADVGDLEKVPANDPVYRSSTVADLHTVGMREIHARQQQPALDASAQGISSAGMDAVRAAMAAHNVRLSQRLNSMMVFLTLAIAGGPFLGLLGTVVGVMVTFAGIAASGDVNINAIAPGIAAALVATVAGLGVAIPALFGYNYVSSRLKEVITENNVFVEEFMASAIETYRR